MSTAPRRRWYRADHDTDDRYLHTCSNLPLCRHLRCGARKDPLRKLRLGRHSFGHNQVPRPKLLPPVTDLRPRRLTRSRYICRQRPGTWLSTAIRGRSAFARRRQLGPSIISAEGPYAQCSDSLRAHTSSANAGKE